MACWGASRPASPGGVTKYDSAPDNVVVDGQSYVLVLPPGLAALERFTNQEAQYGDVAAVPTPYM